MTEFPKIRPIAPKFKEHPFDDPEWIFELKYDGYRGVLYHENGASRLVSKQGKPLVFPNLKKSLEKELGSARLILDTEICSINESGRPIFGDLQAHRGKIMCVVFDIMWLGDNDLRVLPLRDRKVILERFITDKMSSCITKAFYTTGGGIRLFDLCKQHDLEGIVAKRLNSTYTHKADWYKIKNLNYSQTIGRGINWRR